MSVIKQQQQSEIKALRAQHKQELARLRAQHKLVNDEIKATEKQLMTFFKNLNKEEAKSYKPKAVRKSVRKPAQKKPVVEIPQIVAVSEIIVSECEENVYETEQNMVVSEKIVYESQSESEKTFDDSESESESEDDTPKEPAENEFFCPFTEKYMTHEDLVKTFDQHLADGCTYDELLKDCTIPQEKTALQEAFDKFVPESDSDDDEKPVVSKEQQQCQFLGQTMTYDQLVNKIQDLLHRKNSLEIIIDNCKGEIEKKACHQAYSTMDKFVPEPESESDEEPVKKPLSKEEALKEKREQMINDFTEQIFSQGDQIKSSEEFFRNGTIKFNRPAHIKIYPSLKNKIDDACIQQYPTMMTIQEKYNRESKAKTKQGFQKFVMDKIIAPIAFPILDEALKQQFIQMQEQKTQKITFICDMTQEQKEAFRQRMENATGMKTEIHNHDQDFEDVEEEQKQDFQKGSPRKVKISSKVMSRKQKKSLRAEIMKM